eukprot:2785423-Prymnesium_polylepis.1
MFGTVDTWLYKSVAGLAPAPDAVELDKLVVKPEAAALSPKTGPPVTSARILLRTRHGNVSLQWAVRTSDATGGQLVAMNLTLPLGSTAAVYVPDVTTLDQGIAASRAEPSLSIQEGGTPVWSCGKFVPGVPGIVSGAATTDGRFVVLEVLQGSYTLLSSTAS